LYTLQSTSCSRQVVLHDKFHKIEPEEKCQMRWTMLVVLRNCYMWPRRSFYLQIKNLYIWKKTSNTHSIVGHSSNPLNLLFFLNLQKFYWINYYNLFFWEIDYNYCPLSQWHVVKNLLNTNFNFLEKLKHTIENSEI
jgi:hypothetical protein